MKQVIPYDFEQIKQELVTKYQEKGYNAEYEGSNASILATLMSYAISLLNVNTTFGINELLLTQASIDSFAKASARQLSYEPQNRISYRYKICLVAQKDTTLPDNDTTTRLYEIQKYAQFTDGLNKFYYFGDNITRMISNNDITTDNSAKYFDISVKEGLLLLNQDNAADLTFTINEATDASGKLVPLNYIDIPYKNIEDNGIELFLTYYDEGGNLHTDESWSESTSLLIEKDSDLSKKYVRMQNFDYNTSRIYFSIAGIGNNLIPGSIIKANILLSSGSSGVAVSQIEANDITRISGTLINYTGVDTSKIQTVSTNGNDDETIESIKENAPVFFNSANRAVTKDDYISICNRQTTISKTVAWGGEDEIPVKLGNVWLSLTPEYKQRTFTTNADSTIWTLNDAYTVTNIFLRPEEIHSTTYDSYGKVINPGIDDILKDFRFPAIKLWYRNPTQIDFEYKLKVIKYDLKKTRQEIHQDIFNVIDNYFNTHLENFEVDYYNSNLIKRMDTELVDLSGVEVDLSTYIPILNESLVSETDNSNEHNVVIFLARPFESFIDANLDLIPNVLPDISTSNFIVQGDNLTVDFSAVLEPVHPPHIGSMKVFSFAVKYNGVRCGTYTVVNGYAKYIRIDLYIKTTGSTGNTGLYETTPLTTSMFNTYKRVNLVYSTPNFRTAKNTFNRLNRVEFIV